MDKIFYHYSAGLLAKEIRRWPYLGFTVTFYNFFPQQLTMLAPSFFQGTRVETESDKNGIKNAASPRTRVNATRTESYRK